MISFVTWKWQAKQGARNFKSKHVNMLYDMVARWYRHDFRFVCITDDPVGIIPSIDVLPIPVRFDAIDNPQGARFPQCYCRLWTFSEQAKVLGERVLQLDIDVVILGDLHPIVERVEDFVGWCDPRFGWRKIAGGIFLLRTGSMTRVWDDFDPATSPQLAFKAGFQGSDQGWISYCLYPPAGQWTKHDGLVKINWTTEGTRIAPQRARAVFTNGAHPPWNKETRRRYPWIKQYWKEAK